MGASVLGAMPRPSGPGARRHPQRAAADRLATGVCGRRGLRRGDMPAGRVRLRFHRALSLFFCRLLVLQSSPALA
jgi:hypothetical protein